MQDNDHLQLRIAVASILALVGAAFISRLPQLLPGQQAIPWYQSGFFWAGIVIVVIALLILIVSPKNWRRVWFSVINCPYEIKRTYIWWFRSPKWLVSEPIISLNELTPSSTGQTNYTATLSLIIKNRDNYTLEGALYSLTVNIEQGLGRMKVRCILRPNPSYQIKIQPHQEETYKLLLFGACSSSRCLDIKKPYNWGIQGITVSLNGAGYKDLHRGLYIKPFRQEYIGIV
jgi:hypothetical protein